MTKPMFADKYRVIEGAEGYFKVQKLKKISILKLFLCRKCKDKWVNHEGDMYEWVNYSVSDRLSLEEANYQMKHCMAMADGNYETGGAMF
jgi:hypothetical protein